MSQELINLLNNPLVNNTGSSICEKLKNMQTELRAILDNTNSTIEDYKRFYDKYNIKYSSSLEKEVKDYCSIISGAIQINVAKIPQECIDNAKRLCLKLYPYGPETWDYERCMDEYGPYLENIYQTNQSRDVQECIFNTMLGDTELAQNAELGVLFSLILDGQIINCDERDYYNFNEIFSSQEKIKVINECLKTSIVEQRNFLKGCRLANKTQININDNISKCLISTSQKRSTSTPTNLSPSTTLSSATIQPTQPIQQSTTIKPTITKQLTKLTSDEPNTSIYNLILIGIIAFIIFIIIIFIILKFKNII